jgi:hypothetical protein
VQKQIRDGNRAAKAMMLCVRAELGIDPIPERPPWEPGRCSYNEYPDTDGAYFWDDLDIPGE